MVKTTATLAPVMLRRTSKKAAGPRLAVSYRSGLEDRIAKQLESAGVEVVYEDKASVIPYTTPETPHKYTPDFVLPNGIIVESKGIFDATDRKKHQLIKAQHPGKDIRFVFSNSKAKLYKGSPTSYAAWCDKYGFQYADKLIPLAWLEETK